MTAHMRTRHTRTASVHPERPVVPDPDIAPAQRGAPFAEGAGDALDPGLRHRLTREAAYRRYVERNYQDGHDFEDWLEAEAEVDHLFLNRSRPEPS